MMVLRDLLGHSSVVTTEAYLNPQVLHQMGEKSQVTRSARLSWAVPTRRSEQGVWHSSFV
jgi:hypothetical protein